eukprot:gene8246-5767_t
MFYSAPRAPLLYRSFLFYHCGVPVMFFRTAVHHEYAHLRNPRLSDSFVLYLSGSSTSLSFPNPHSSAFKFIRCTAGLRAVKCKLFFSCVEDHRFLSTHYSLQLMHAPAKAQQHQHGRQLISELCRVLKDWRTPTGLSIAVRENDHAYIAPSCEDRSYEVRPEDVFVLDRHDNVVSRPSSSFLLLDECCPLFLAAFRLRSAEACIYTTSKAAAQVSMMFDSEFRMSNVQLNKVRKDVHQRSLTQGTTVVIPIVDFSDDRKEMIDAAVARLLHSRDCQAIIFRGRGVCVWEDSWPRAKVALEFVQYLMQLAVQMNMLQVPIDPLQRGSYGPYVQGSRSSYIRLAYLQRFEMHFEIPYHIPSNILMFEMTIKERSDEACFPREFAVCLRFLEAISFDTADSQKKLYIYALPVNSILLCEQERVSVYTPQLVISIHSLASSVAPPVPPHSSHTP